MKGVQKAKAIIQITSLQYYIGISLETRPSAFAGKNILHKKNIDRLFRLEREK